MLKKILIFVAVLAVLGVIALVAIGFFINPIITKGVNSIAPKITGTKVELASTNVSMLTGGGHLKGLFVGNPEGWKSDKAFYLGEIRVSVVPTSLLSDCIVINEVFIDSPEFVYETNLRSSNIAALQKQIQDNLGMGGSGSEQPGETPASGSAKKIILKSFKLQGGKVTLGLGASAITVPMPPLSITDLGVAEGGITPDQAVSAVMKAVLNNVTKAATGALLNGGGAGVDGIKDATKGVTEGLKGLFGK